MYELRLHKDAARFYQKAEASLVRRLNRCFEYLRQDPFLHPNIRQLKKPMWGYRCRVGNWRVFYEVNSQARLVNILRIAHRREAYRR